MLKSLANRTTLAWYTEQDEMVDLDGNLVGHCTVDMSTDEYCDVTLGRERFQSLLFCTEL